MDFRQPKRFALSFCKFFYRHCIRISIAIVYPALVV
jgi:hypothetical protein